MVEITRGPRFLVGTKVRLTDEYKRQYPATAGEHPEPGAVVEFLQSGGGAYYDELCVRFSNGKHGWFFQHDLAEQL